MADDRLWFEKKTWNVIFSKTVKVLQNLKQALISYGGNAVYGNGCFVLIELI